MESNKTKTSKKVKEKQTLEEALSRGELFEQWMRMRRDFLLCTFPDINVIQTSIVCQTYTDRTIQLMFLAGLDLGSAWKLVMNDKDLVEKLKKAFEGEKHGKV